jgi:hypothetical protein
LQTALYLNGIFALGCTKEQKGNMRTDRFELFRARTLPDAGGRTLFFHTKTTDRRHPSHFFDPQEVPEFEGESAWFEVEWRDKRWRVTRRVDEVGVPSRPADADAAW